MKVGKPEEPELETKPLGEFLDLLNMWLKSDSAEERMKITHEFENLAGDYRAKGATDEIEEIIGDLCNDCAYYSEISLHYSGAPGMLNYEKFKKRIVEALRKIDEFQSENS